MKVNKELWLFKVAQVLIEKYGYSLIDVRAIQEEIWLNHPDKPEFGLIRLSLYKGFDLKNIKERTMKIKQAILQILPNVAKFWDVEIDEEGSLQEDETERIHIVISPDTESKLFEVFPEIKLAFTQSDDPEKELEELKKRIQVTHTPKKPLTWLEQVKLLPKMTVGILILCTIITLAINGISLLGYDIISISILFGAYYKTFILANYEIWRFFTAGFIHIDIFHLAMNGMALINIGSFVERLYGPKRLLLILINGIFFGSFFVFVGQGNVLLVGLSGGLYALLGVMLVYLYETGLIRQPMIQTQVLRMVFMNVLINFLPNI
ncbi:MAG TPA: rhomboid family intramembrane serine protease, partial [Erysipelotrichaceae bacterium]|nr:rhomboid family intramembrane serine protease [Erysipelotrichaceae bacterium]